MRSLFIRLFPIVLLAVASCSDDGSDPAAAPPAPEEPFTLPVNPKQGAVSVFVRPESPGAEPSFYAAAFFLDYGGKGNPIPDGFSRGNSKATACTKRKSGTCELVSCKLIADPGQTLAVPQYVPAGEITVKRSSGGELDLKPDVQNTYNSSLPVSGPANAGETVEIAGTGGTVPAFTEKLSFASAVSPVSPKMEAVAGHDVEIAWTGGSVGTVVLSGETGTEEQGFIAKLTCRFDAAAGKGTIPGGVLAGLSGNDIAIGFDGDAQTKDVGGYQVSFVAQTSSDLVESGVILTLK